MRTVSVPRSPICYTPVGNDVMASMKNSKHTLLWERRSGSVYRDSDRRPLYYHLTEPVFRAEAEAMFTNRRLDTRGAHTDRQCAKRGATRVNCADDGAGWQATCGCGHWRTGWKPSRWAARRALAAHIAEVRAAANAKPLDLADIKRAGVRVPKQRNAS